MRRCRLVGGFGVLAQGTTQYPALWPKRAYENKVGIRADQTGWHGGLRYVPHVTLEVVTDTEYYPLRGWSNEVYSQLTQTGGRQGMWATRRRILGAVGWAQLGRASRALAFWLSMLRA